MFILIERYMDKLNINDVNNYLLNNNISLNNEELEFSYNFIKKNWKSIISNISSFNISKYKEKFSEENYIKLQLLLKESILKYQNYL